jgi:uncharacterized membrane protein (UPF0127 family)
MVFEGRESGLIPALTRAARLRPAARACRGLWWLFFIFTVHCTAAGSPKLTARSLIIETASGGVALNAEIAISEADRARGLMNRKSLADGEGMLFVYDRDEIMSFWMKNTLIPLSIAFIAYDGRILEIRDMKPQDLTPVRSSRSVRYALEVPQGWFGRAGIAPGDRLLTDSTALPHPPSGPLQ